MRGGGIRLALLLAAGVAPGGCGALFGTGSQGFASSGCENLSSGACEEQVARVAARHPGAKDVDLRCGVATCDRRGGSGTAVVAMPDGTTVQDVFTYVGAQAAVPAPTCRGLPPDVCKTVADGQVDGIAPSMVVVAVDVACTSTVCTAARGEAAVTVTLGDGSKQEGNVGWESAGQ
jgi:hypothetical protein